MTFVIEELKLFATALKMGAAFLSVDKLAQKWIEQEYEGGRTWKDLNPRELEEDEKREWYDLHDSWERANKELRGKLQRFETDPYSQGASPILRYERIVDQYGVKGKLFLGLNSHQAKGYRIVELDHPRWLEQLMQTDSDTFRSENLSEGEVYALVPSRGIDQEKLSVLRNDFWDDLKAAGVPAWDTAYLVGGHSTMKPEFVSRFDKAVDTRLPFDSNVLRVQALVEQIKREHALAVPAPPGRLAVGPPAVVITAAVPSPKPVRPAPKYAKSQEVIYQGAKYIILDLAFQNGVWLYELNAPGVSLFRPENEIQPSPEQLLSIYTVQGVRFVEGFEDQGAAFRKADEMRKQFPGSVYRVVKPEVLQHKWHPFEVWIVNRGYEVPEKIRVAEPLKTVSTPLYTTAHVTPPAAKFKKGDIVQHRDETYPVKSSEFSSGKWYYIMDYVHYRRLPEDELILAPSPEEVKEEAKLEKEAEKEIEHGKIIEEEIEQVEGPELVKPTPMVPVEKPAVTQPTKPTVTTQPTPTTPAPTPRPTKILSSEDMRLLQDYWNTQFIRAIGKVPAGFGSVFRIEFQEVKMLPFAEAKAAILAAADREIEGIESAQRARAVIREGERIRLGQPLKAPLGRREEVPVGEEEERLPLATGRVTPSAFPTNPLSVMQPFPRGPTSLEQLRLWKVFCYEVQQEGYDCNPYAKDFAEYIGKSQFLSWQDLRQRFEFFENTIMEGATLPPLVQWRAKLTTPTGLRGELQELEPSPEPANLTTQQIEEEEKNAVKRQRILISHWAAALIHQARYYNKEKTMLDLYEEVVARGVIDASIPEEIFLPIAKEAIREVYSQKLRPVEFVKTDGEEEEVEKLNLAKVPYVDISQAEIDEFLATG